MLPSNTLMSKEKIFLHENNLLTLVIHHLYLSKYQLGRINCTESCYIKRLVHCSLVKQVNVFDIVINGMSGTEVIFSKQHLRKIKWKNCSLLRSYCILSDSANFYLSSDVATTWKSDFAIFQWCISYFHLVRFVQLPYEILIPSSYTDLLLG